MKMMLAQVTLNRGPDLSGLSAAQIYSDLPTRTVQLFDDNHTPIEGQILDFEQMTIRDLPATTVTYNLLDTLRAISDRADLSHLIPGQLASADQYLTIGAFSSGAFGLDQWSLKDITQLTGANIAATPLSEFGNVIEFLSPQSLVNGVARFGQLQLTNVPVLARLWQFTNGFLGDDLHDLTVFDAIDLSTEFADSPLGRLGATELAQFTIEDLPGLEATPIGALPIDDAMLEDLIPTGLIDKLEFARYPTPPKLVDWARIGRIDVPLNAIEQHRVRVVSGGVPGKNFKVEPCPGTDCTHVELHEVGIGQYSGYAWMTTDQKVTDGFGSLCLPFGCEGPAGNHPFGRGFRMLFANLDEAAGTVEARISFRHCKRFPIYTCTPYALPTPEGIPIAVLPEKFLVPFAPPGTQLGGEDFNYGSPGASSGNSNQCTSGVATGDTVDQAVNVIQSWGYAGASEHVPYLLAAAQKHGITDSAQLAYILSTVGTETSYRGPIEEDPQLCKGAWYAGVDSTTGHRYYGRGYVQVTHKENYQKIGKAIGIDLVNNPDLLLDPEIAAEAAVVGMRDGIFTGVGLDNYGKGDNFDFNGARWIINDSDKAAAVGADADQIYQSISTTNPGDINTSGGTCPESSGSGSSANSAETGDYNPSIMRAVQENFGINTRWPGTDDGYNACAASVNHVLQDAGITPLAGGSYYVPDVQNALANGRGVLVPASDAQPGDIAIAAGTAHGGGYHIGIVTGSNEVTSNSSSRGTWNWVSDLNFDGAYDNKGQTLVYRIVR